MSARPVPFRFSDMHIFHIIIIPTCRHFAEACCKNVRLHTCVRHPRLRARHSPFAINQTIRDRWMRLMENALGEASLPSKAEEVLRKFFNEMSTFMINQSEPGIS
jgi:hypothetical protein